MAPERPRSVNYDISMGPRIIERKPETEVREVPTFKPEGRSNKMTIGFKLPELFRPIQIEKVQPRSILRHPGSDIDEAEYVDLREPRRPRPPPIHHQRQLSDDFVPLPPAIPSPRHQAGDEIPIFETRIPRGRPIIDSPSQPHREPRRRRTPSSSPSPVREVETIRIRRLDKADRGKADRLRIRKVQEETRNERERRHEVEDANRHLAEFALRERFERRRAQRDAHDAEAHRRSAEIAAAYLQRENERLEHERRDAERAAALLEQEQERERERVRDAIRHAQDVPRHVRGAPQVRREAPRPPRDRGADVIRAAQEARRQDPGERISYYHNGRRIEHDPYD